MRVPSLVSCSLLSCCLLAWAQPSQASVFADRIEAFAPGGADLGSGTIDPEYCAGVPQAFDLSFALGPTDGRYVSVGEEGSITVGFFGRAIIDEPGDDFVVWGSCNAENEPGIVLVSPDGTNFILLGPFSTGTSRSFDLSAAGLASVLQVRLVDLPGGAGLPIGLAFDLDTVEALHIKEVPVATARNTWGRTKLLYR